MNGRAAVGVYFFLHGVLNIGWLYQSSVAAGRLDGDARLVLSLAAIVMLAGMPLGAWLVGRLGARRVTVWAALGSSVVMSGMALTRDVAVLLPATVVFGLAIGTVLVAMNTLAAGVERATGRLFLPWCHGLLALGTLVGGVLSVVLLQARVSPQEQLLWIGAVSVVVIVGLARVLPEVELPDTSPRLPPNFAALAGTVVAVMLAAEVIRSSSWRFYETTSSISIDVFGLRGSHFFVLGLAVGGLAGGAVAARIGLRNLLNAGAVVTALGLVWLVLSSTLTVATVGFFVAGAGLSCMFPVLLNLAAANGSARHSIAALTAIGYLAASMGTYLFGLLGNVLDQRYALAYLLVVPVLLFGLSRAVASPDHAGT